MELERRGRVRRSHARSNWKQEDLDACDRRAVWSACLPDGRRVRRESHARFCERPVVKFRRPTHPCAACHTGQLNYQGTGIRIDGGPAGTDMDSFLRALAAALWTVRVDKGDIHARFVKNVIDRGHYDSEKDVDDDLQKYAYRLEMYNIINHSEDHYGYSRVDAFGRIYHRVLQHL